MTAEKKAEKKQTKQGFEDSMAQLEKIVAEMEEGGLSLEEMIDRFEKGRNLVKICTKTLNEVERKIELLVKKGEDVVAEPFEPGADEDLF